MPPRPGTTTRPTPDDGLRSTAEVAAALDVTAIRLYRLIDAGHLTPTVCGRGRGSRVRWSDQDMAEAGRIIARIDWGMTAEAATRTIDPPLPAPGVPAGDGLSEGEFVAVLSDLPSGGPDVEVHARDFLTGEALWVDARLVDQRSPVRMVCRHKTGEVA